MWNKRKRGSTKEELQAARWVCGVCWRWASTEPGVCGDCQFDLIDIQRRENQQLLLDEANRTIKKSYRGNRLIVLALILLLSQVAGRVFEFFVTPDFIEKTSGYFAPMTAARILLLIAKTIQYACALVGVGIMLAVVRLRLPRVGKVLLRRRAQYQEPPPNDTESEVPDLSTFSSRFFSEVQITDDSPTQAGISDDPVSDDDPIDVPALLEALGATMHGAKVAGQL